MGPTQMSPAQMTATRLTAARLTATCDRPEPKERNPMRVVFWARLQLARRRVSEGLAAVPGAELVEVETLPDLLAALPGADGLVVYDAAPDLARPVTAALSAPGNTVRWMHFLTAGREGFEAAGLPSGIAITAAAGAISPTVAEHALALLMALNRRIPTILEHQSRNLWSRDGIMGPMATLEGCRLAIIGYGNIGREIARRARAFDAVVIGVSRRAPQDEPLLDEAAAFDDLDSVVAGADAIVLTAALTPQTRHMFDDRRLALCRPGARLVNVARGGLIDQDALARALAAGRLAGAGLDVTDPEPLPADSPLWAAPNLILGPHVAAGGSAASLQRLADSASGNLARLIRGEDLLHRVA